MRRTSLYLRCEEPCDPYPRSAHGPREQVRQQGVEERRVARQQLGKVGISQGLHKHLSFRCVSALSPEAAGHGQHRLPQAMTTSAADLAGLACFSTREHKALGSIERTCNALAQGTAAASPSERACPSHSDPAGIAALTPGGKGQQPSWPGRLPHQSLRNSNMVVPVLFRSLYDICCSAAQYIIRSARAEGVPAFREKYHLSHQGIVWDGHRARPACALSIFSVMKTEAKGSRDKHVPEERL